jgi:hypothetical protein
VKTQFLHEHHNRQDKARKPEYRQDMLEKGRPASVASGSSRALARAKAPEELIANIRKCRFVFRGHNFKFGWSLDVFARKNCLPLDQKAGAAMQAAQEAAQRDVDAFSARIKDATIRDRGYYYQFDYERPATECQILSK